jgi:hypothetical protein
MTLRAMVRARPVSPSLPAGMRRFYRAGVMMQTVPLLLIAAALIASRASLAASPAAGPSGEVVCPMDHAVELVLPDGVTVTLEPGTRGHWFPRTRLPSETNGWAVGYHFALTDGEIGVRMPAGARGSHAFLVSTPQGTLTDWRGKLHVSTHGETSAAAIYEGALVVGSNGIGFAVYDGAGILMRKGINPDKSRHIPDAPQWVGGVARSSFMVAPAETHPIVRLAWGAVAGAAGYRVLIAADPAMSRVLEVATTTETSFDLVERPPDTRYWTEVRAVGSEGIVGEWSAPRPVRVVHYALPDGAFVARDGAVVLRPGESIALSGADGIEVSFTTTMQGFPSAPVPLYWSKVGAALALPDDPDVVDRLVHLRDPGIGLETSLRLARRQLRADIQLSPKNAHTGDPLDVRALVWDPSGRIDGATADVSLKVMQEIDPVAVAWQRTGNVWMTHLPQRARSGPTVVRVVATDDRGIEIGRGFLELEGTPMSGR